MTRTLKRIDPLKLGIVAGIFYALFSLILMPFLLLAAASAAFSPHPANAAQPGLGIGIAFVFAIMAPILYGMMGFIFGVIGGWIYNLVASWTGGIEFEVE